MTQSDLETLLIAVDGDRRAAERHGSLALSLRARVTEPLAQTAIAASLHHFYSACESALERLLRAFGQSTLSGDRWHQELLAAATFTLPGVRPAILRSETATILRKLLAFRHFFRHAYAATWDHEELAKNLDLLAAVHPLFEKDLDDFATALRAAADTTGG